MVENSKIQVSKANMSISERQQLVAGVFSSKAVADNAMKKIKMFSPKLKKVNASDVLVLAKDDKGKVHINAIDIGSTSDVNIAELAECITADLRNIAGKPIGSPTELNVQATHLGHALNPGTVAIALFADPQYAARVEEGIREIGASILTKDDLKHIGAGLAAAEGTNDLTVKAVELPEAEPQPAPAVFIWQAEYAYSVALQAFIYGFPYIYNAYTRYKWTNIPQNSKSVPYMPVNNFWHAAELIDAAYRDGGCPNNDTLYSIDCVIATCY